MKESVYQRWSCIFLAVIALNLSFLTVHHIGFGATRSERAAEMALPVAVHKSADQVLKVRFEEDVLPVRIAEVDNFIFGRLPVEVRNEVLKVEVGNQPLDVKMR